MISEFLNQSPVLIATVMLALTGLLVAGLFRVFTVKSLRLQSLLLGVVLLQGVMLARIPIHLGLWRSETTETFVFRSFSTDKARPSQSDRPVATDAVDESRWGVVATAVPKMRASKEINTHAATLSPMPLNAQWIPRIAVFIWATGVALLVGRAIWSYMSLVRLVRRLPVADRRYQLEWLHTLRSCGLSQRRCPVLKSESVGPMIVRLPMHYALIVPEDYWTYLSDIQRCGVMEHEAQHLVRRDVWCQLAARVIATIHWFNPVAWWAADRLDETAELACDQAVARRGEAYSTGFASALLLLVSGSGGNHGPAIACTAMATPPLSRRISNLLAPSTPKDPAMKTLLLVFVSGLVALGSCVQFRLSAADAENAVVDVAGRVEGGLAVMDESSLKRVVSQFNSLPESDPMRGPLLQLTKTSGGRLALSAYLDSLRNASVNAIKNQALEFYSESVFDQTSTGWTLKDPTRAQKWNKAAERLSESLASVARARDEVVDRIKDDSEAGVLLKRFLEDPDFGITLLILEMDGGGDPVAAYINKALAKILVQRGDGQFQVIASAETQATEQIKKLEFAAAVAKRLRRQLPVFAVDLDESDEQSGRLADYLENPVTANVLAVHLAKDIDSGPATAVEKLFQSLESACDETAGGLKLRDEEALTQIEEVYRHVDRASGLVDRVSERLGEIADAMAEGEVSQKLAAVMREDCLATMVAAEIPYSDSMAGDQMKELFTQVLEDNPEGGLRVRQERAEEVSGKMSELLRNCRQVRRHAASVDGILERVSDREIVKELGDVGRYVLLDEIRRFVETQRPDPIELMREDLFGSQGGDAELIVRDERRKLVNQLVSQAERLNQTDSRDDF